MVTSWALALASASPAPCGLALVADRLDYRPLPEALRLTEGPKAERDVYGLPLVRSSENFAVRWGTAAAIEPRAVDALLDTLEAAWQRFVEELDHPPPPGSATYQFNVYLGDTGDGAPPTYGTAGYFQTDDEDHPMVVISPTTLASPQHADSVAVHELYHALQYATDRYPYLGPSSWWWEASAEWAADEMAPVSPFSGSFLFAYAGLSPLPLAFFDYPDTQAIEELYQYGAFVFATHLTDRVSPSAVRDTWLDPGSEPDVIEVVRALLAERDLALEEVFLDHIERNATWDYVNGAYWAQIVGDLTAAYDLDAVSGQYAHSGTRGELAIGPHAPGHFGYNAIRLRQPNEGTLEVEIRGEAEGTFGSPAGYGARLVQVWTDGSLAYHPVRFDGVTGAARLEVGSEEEVWLMVGAWGAPAGYAWADERFPYRYALTVVPEPAPGDHAVPPPASAPSRCGCAPTPAGAPAALWGLLAATWMVSRRTSRCSHRASFRPG